MLPFDCEIDISIDETCWLDKKIAAPDWIKDVVGITLEHILPELSLDTYPKDSSVVISLLLTNDQRIQSLNREFRSLDKPTNVLSFPDTDLSEDALKETSIFKEALALGDIAFAEETIRREAIEQKKSLGNHFAHLIVHGVLHLAGYDHINDDEAEHMEALEVQILAKLKIDNPYELNGNSARMVLD